MVREVAKLGWKLQPDAIKVDIGQRHALQQEWGTLRTQITCEYKLAAWRRLVKRRPVTYAGLVSIDVKRHKKLLSKKVPYVASMLVRIRSGCILARETKNRMSLDQGPACQCGFPAQTVRHLLYDCPAVERPHLCHAWKERDEYSSTCLVLAEE